MGNFINEKFSTRAKNALIGAQKISRQLGHLYIGTEHLLYGIIAEISSFASEVLLKNQISQEAVKLELIRVNPPLSPASSWLPKVSENLRQVMEKSAVVAAKYQYQFIGTEHFLYGIVEESSNTAQKILKNMKIEPQEIKKNLMAIFENVSKFGENSQAPFRESQRDLEEQTTLPPTLDYFTTDITRKARQGKIDPLVGREKEVQRLISILNRRNKNNPALIGEPGVGKTAIVEGLALKIRDRQVPDSLLGKRILTLDLALIVAGSMFRGEFENRLKQIIEEVKEAQDIILFIDEIHTLVGAGAVTGSLDAANILKPALARGELRAIGATTLEEYKKYIEQDAALERRFQPIFIKEPTPEETLEILKGLRPNYEAHHEVEILDEALLAAVKLSVRYLPDRFLPDKAIDLVDETAAFHKMIFRRDDGKVSLKKIERDLADLAEQKKQAVLAQDFTRALALKNKESRLLHAKHNILKNKKQDKSRLKITASHMAETVSRITGIPISALMRKEDQKLLALEKNLKKQIVGQDQALSEVGAAIHRSRAGIAEAQRPLASFLFLGPTGVGKTLLAKLLAKEIFEDEQSLIRIDMSELMERHNVARLIGAPAGYVGYEEGGRLTEAVRRRPYAVVLFDEIEKAHRDVHNILLQILEEGELTDAAGKKINFRNTIIILTSNIGLPSLNQWAENFGFGESQRQESSEVYKDKIKQEVLGQIRQFFRPEFLNRIDKIIVFNPLSRGNMKKIVQLEIKKLQTKLAEQKIKLAASRQVLSHLANLSFEATQGARLVRKNLQDLVENKIAQAILHKQIRAPATIKLKLNSKKVIGIE